MERLEVSEASASWAREVSVERFEVSEASASLAREVSVERLEVNTFSEDRAIEVSVERLIVSDASAFRERFRSSESVCNLALRSVSKRFMIAFSAKSAREASIFTVAIAEFKFSVSASMALMISSDKFFEILVSTLFALKTSDERLDVKVKIAFLSSVPIVSK